MARLLQLGVIPPKALEHKYKSDIFANEFVLLSYYIASINIKQVYHQVRTEQGVDEGYVEFPGMTLTDTFKLHEVRHDHRGLRVPGGQQRTHEGGEGPAITVIVIKRSTRQLMQSDGVRGFDLAA